MPLKTNFIFYFLLFLGVISFAQHAGGICSTCISCETCSSSLNGGEVGKKCVKIPYNQADTICGTPDNPPYKRGYRLVFQDEFEGELDTIHLKTASVATTEILAKGNMHTKKMYNGQNIQGIYPKWRVFDGKIVGSNPDLIAKPENLVCKKGKLALQILENGQDSLKYTTGNIQTSAFVRFGYFEAKIKIPKGKSLWPSLWLYSSYPDNCIYQEIDIMEFMQNGTIDGDVFAGSVGHNGDRGTTHRYSSGKILKEYPVCNKLFSKGFYVYPYTEGCSFGLKRTLDLSKDYFIYALEWSKDSIIYYLNNTRIYALKNDANIRELPMGLIMGTSMMSGHGHTNILCKDNLPNEYTSFPNSYSIEYVRIYKKEESFEDLLSLFPETEYIKNQSLRKVGIREFYPNTEFRLALFTEKGTEIVNFENGFEGGQYDALLLYKIPADLTVGNYIWKLTVTLFDGTKKEIEKKVQIF